MVRNSGIFLSALLLSVSVLPAPAATDGDVEGNRRLFHTLDSVIADHDGVCAAKERRISAMRLQLRPEDSPALRLGMASRLYDEYLVYDADSALYYARMCHGLISPDDYGSRALWKVNEAYVYIMQGLFEEARALLDDVDAARLDAADRRQYFNVMSRYHSMRSLYTSLSGKSGEEDMRMAVAYRDSLASSGGMDNPAWLWVPVAVAVEREGDYRPDRTAIERLRSAVDNSDTPSRLNAINAYWLSRHCRRAGDTEGMVRYLAISAVNDASIANCESAAVGELATYLFEHGDVARANAYLTYDDMLASRYRNRARMLHISPALTAVREAYSAAIESRDRRLRRLVAGLGALAAALLACSGFVIYEYRRLRRAERQLTATNATLAEALAARDRAIEGLEAVNAELSEANAQRLRVLADSIRLSTDYINALEEYRRKLSVRYRGKQMSELGALIDNPEMIKDRFQDFYEGFDRMALAIFPDLVEDYNASVASPDLRVDAGKIAATGTLNTRLRIHILRRFGVTKSADIAQMLNISIRTVYNNRTPGSQP